MSLRRISVQVPASASNLGSGFDVLGVAVQIHSRYDITFRESGPPLEIEASGLNAEKIPTGEENLAYQAFRTLFDEQGKTPPPITIRILNGIPLERGLGGSGSAIIGGLLAANAWLGGPYDDLTLLRFATEMDGHPDNVAASFFGGLRVACWDGSRLYTLPVRCSDDLQIVFAVPKMRVVTKAARQILPENVTLEDAVFNVGRVALLVAAFASLEYAYLDAGMQDNLHQRYRQLLVPQLYAVIDAAREAGAWSAALSGSGPTIAAFCSGGAEAVGDAMAEAFAEGDVDATIHITTIDFRGACVAVSDEDGNS